jgi:FlaA1/EpsC-like NDP-sugar epimerase
MRATKCCTRWQMQTSPSWLPTLYPHRRPLIGLFHVVLIIASSWLAMLLRFDGSIPDVEWQLWWQVLGALVLIRGLAFMPLRLYEGLWRYTGIWDLRNIIVGVVGSSLVFFVLVRVVLGLTRYPLTVFIIDSLILIVLMGGVRLTRRIYGELWPASSRERRVLVFGAGGAGEMIVRDMRSDRASVYEPIGFIDDDIAKVGQRIHGVPVLGTRTNLARIIRERKPTEFLIAVPSVEPHVLRSVLRALEPFKLPIKTLPNLRDVLSGRVTMNQIRDLVVEDLLSRAPVGLDASPVLTLLGGRRVLIAGAGGSIGSELARQIVAAGASHVILFERHEHSLYTIMNELEARRSAPVVLPIIGDVTDAVRLDQVFADYHPEIVFHAAAHKHVPLMEQNPCEAVKNNVKGTRLLAECAKRFGVERFIFISSDKAVHPTSVMGATKRASELTLQALAPQSRTHFLTVRFGNVLASSGSVVPRFLAQIKAGGPVTVTHPEMRRYFMLIPEAVQLVLHAAARGDAGDVYALEMGEQIRIVDLARNLIRLCGFIPGEDIVISFIGRRPGEKLEEQLVDENEIIGPSGHDKIIRVRPGTSKPGPEIMRQVLALEILAEMGQVSDVLDALRVLVPTFQTDGQLYQAPLMPTATEFLSRVRSASS